MIRKSFSKVLFSVWMLLVVFFILYKGILPAWEEEASDFSNYYVASHLLMEGESIANFYDNDWFYEKAIESGVNTGAKFSPFPPATAFLYLPLTFFKPLLAKRIWLVANVLFLIVLMFQLRSITSLSLVEIAFVLSLFFIPIASNIRLGQSYLLFALLLVQFLKSLQRKNYFLGGGLLGIASALKYFPIIYLLYAIPKLHKKTILGFSVFVLIICVLPLAVNGPLPYEAFFREFLNHMNGNLSGQGRFSYTFQSMDALLSNLFVYDVENNPKAIFRIAGLKEVIKLLFALLLLMLSANALRRGVHKAKELSIAICLVAASLIVPASASYHLLLLSPAILLVVDFLRKQRLFKKELIIFLLLTFLVGTILPHHIPTLNTNATLNTLIHFPRLYGLMLLFVFLWILQKRYLKVSG